MSRYSQRKKLYDRQDGICAYCFNEMTFDNNRPNTVTRDHVIPRSKGGPSSMFNLIGVCATCNQLKSDKPLLEFLTHITGGHPDFHPMFHRFLA